MKIAFITPSISRAAGGIFEIERCLGQSLARIVGTEVSVCALQDEHTAADTAAWLPLKPQVFPVLGARGFGYSAPLNAAFLREQADVAHLHALWMFPSIVVRRWGRLHRRPYLVTPNGMLEPWALKNSAWKKRLARLVYEQDTLDGAACLQANTEKEAADIRAFGLKNPIAIIPNGIDLPASKDPNAESRNPPWRDCLEPGRKVLLFLSRIHPKKGLLNLLRAWKPALTSSSGWTLVIAGWDQSGHEAELKQHATEWGIPWADAREKPGTPSSILHPQPSLLFIGPQFNETKAACYANCDAFILPSFSEGLPMVILEAWAHGKPVLMTPECNLPEGFAANAAVRIDPNAESIARGLAEMFRASPSELQTRGNAGRALVAEKFSWPKIAADMKSVYDWVLGNGPKPDCVTLN